MSVQMKESILNLVLWLVVAALFVIVFFSGDAISDWGDNATKILLLAVLIGVGYIGQLILSIVFRKRKDVIIKDERDEMILNKAISNSFIVTLVYVFIIAISLYIGYEKSGFVPVAWLWFIAYSLILVSNITASSFLIYHHRRGGN